MTQSTKVEPEGENLALKPDRHKPVVFLYFLKCGNLNFYLFLLIRIHASETP